MAFGGNEAADAVSIPERGSYQGQDAFVIEALGGMREGFFLDSGASDGIRGSNSLVLETQFGWSGICIEPNERFFDRLRSNRGCICINCCIWHSSGMVPFLEGAGVYGGIIDAYEPSFRQFAEEAARAASGQAAEPVLKQGREIREILDTCRAPEIIDYWSLDTEGSELAILQSFPFENYRVRILSVEHNYSSSRREIRQFLAHHGMFRVKELGIDDVYMSRSPQTGSGWRSRAWRRSR